MRTTRKQQRGSNPLPADILLTLPELGIDVEKVVRDEAYALCPNPKHGDNDPSWSINLETGEHFCFSCGWGGNYLMLVKKSKGFEEDEPAEQWVRKHGGIAVARKKLRGETSYTKKQADKVTEADLALFDAEIPQEVLDSRNITQEAAEAYGVLWDARHDRWILPIREPFTQRLVGWQEKGKRHFRNVPEHIEKSLTLFGYHLLGDTAYVEESPLDPVRLRSVGVEGGVSSYGVYVSDFQMDLIIEHPKVKRVVMCLDNDEAGRKKEAEIWQEYRGRTRLYFANYEHTRKKDHGEMDAEEIAYSLDNAISAVRFRP